MKCTACNTSIYLECTGVVDLGEDHHRENYECGQCGASGWFEMMPDGSVKQGGCL